MAITHKLRIGPLRIGYRRRERNLLYDEKADRAWRELKQELGSYVEPLVAWLNRILAGRKR